MLNCLDFYFISHLVVDLILISILVCGEADALRAVLASGANVSTPDVNGGSPLHYA